MIRRPPRSTRFPHTTLCRSDVHTVDDPYRWLPTLGEVDLHLIGEGRHERLWDALGAHVRTYDTPNGPVGGNSFALWAPTDRKSTRLNSSHANILYAVFCLKK